MKNLTKSTYYLVIFLTLLFLDNNLALASSWEDEGITLKLPSQEIKASKEDISNWIEIKPSLRYFKNYNSEIENTDFCPTTKIICNLTKTTREKYSTQKIEAQTLNEEKIKLFLENLATKLNKEPTNATFTVEDGKVSNFSLSQDGYKINISESIKNIKNILSSKNKNSNELTLSIDTIEPEIKANSAEKLGIKELIGEGKSNFTGSTLNRIHNIKVATARFDGILIKPGEEFSFVKILGDVDGEHGYKQELVIKKGVTEPEFGGGVCQVSTTAFRAAIYTGLEITARKNHAYPVHYYTPHGMDSTVYIPNPDLKFKNNTPGHILVKTDLNIEKKELIFRFYGTSDGRKIEVDGPHILSRQPDGAMKTVFNQKVFDASGNIFIDKDFNSSYNSPNDYPKPGEFLTSKPKDWSNKEWAEYKKDNKL